MTATPLLAGRYELGTLLGRGGMADVYEAVDRTLSRPVAVKLMRGSAGDESDRHRFIAEARTLARLSHSGLVTVLDAGFGASIGAAAPDGDPAIAPEQPFLVMELVEGRTLDAAIVEGPLPLEEAGSIGVQLAEALDYVHAHGVVHRDIKPGNVLLGEQHRVKLADFGIARLLGDTARQTRTGQLIGTVAYLSPEQVTGEEVSGATDVYSLGLVLLEALTADREYPGTATEAALLRLSRPPRIPEHLPQLWRRLLAQMTALDPAERPDAGAVGEALRSQPTGPIPVAAERPTDAVTVPLLAAGGEPAAPAPSTRVLTGSTRPGQTTRGAPHTSIIDRAGDALARQPQAIIQRLRSLAPHQRGLAAAMGALVLLLVIVAIAGNSGTGSSDLPENTPTELQEPLQDLHDAVHGTG